MNLKEKANAVVTHLVGRVLNIQHRYFACIDSPRRMVQKERLRADCNVSEHVWRNPWQVRML